MCVCVYVCTQSTCGWCVNGCWSVGAGVGEIGMGQWVWTGEHACLCVWIVPSSCTRISTTVEPLYSGHPKDHLKCPD